MIARASARVLRRSYSTTPTFPPLDKMMLPHQYKERLHAEQSVKFWKKVNWFFTIPVLVLVAAYTLPGELKHIEHLKAHPNEYVPLPHMRKRKSTYAWGNGDHTLFHNKYANPVFIRINNPEPRRGIVSMKAFSNYSWRQ